MDNQTTPSEPIAETPVQAPEPTMAPIEPEPSQPTVSEPVDIPPDAPGSPQDTVTPVPVENPSNTEALGNEQNQGVNQQSQPLAQQDQTGFIRGLLIKAQTKIQFNKQKKLDRIIFIR